MLEEALRNTTHSPAEAALALLSFVQVELPAGGASAEDRFFNLFIPLCERVFGRLSKPEQQYTHELGGWLSREIRWERPQSSLSAPPSSPFANQMGRVVHANRSSNSSISADPVIKLLGTSSPAAPKEQHTPTLIEAFTKEAEHYPNLRYPFPFHALPKPTQDAFISLLESALSAVAFAPSSVGPSVPDAGSKRPSENSARLFGVLLREKPIDQGQLRMYRQRQAQKKEQRRPLQLTPAYPVSPSNSTTNKGKEKDVPPNIMLSMLEYYLFMFIRYPLAAPKPPAKQQSAPMTTVGGVPIPQRKSEHYGEAVYYQLFYEYLRHFLVCEKARSQFHGFHILSRPSELFLRIVIELWIEGQNQLQSTVEILKEQRERGGGNFNYDLNLSFDLVKGKYNPRPFQVQRCIRRLVVRTVCDGTILEACRDIYDGGQATSPPDSWCLSPNMTILQLPFYNYVRTAFRNASIHTSQSAFFAAFNAWLIWLEPWNATHDVSKNHTATRILNSVTSAATDSKKQPLEIRVPKPTDRSRYTPSWEPYIAANLYLYTVPLAIFLRRARELDFSPKEFHSSLRVVQRVFRVYTPAVVNVLKGLLNHRDLESRFASILSRHENNLGEYAPSHDWILTLTSCQQDMHNLLEEIHIQHQKKVGELDFFDRVAASLEGVFGQGVVSGEEKEMSALVSQAKNIVGFAANYEVIPKISDGTIVGDRMPRGGDDIHSERTDIGVLSDVGRNRLIHGAEKCNPLDAVDVGDRMTGRPQSHEVAFLVPLLIRLSGYLNGRLGLVPESQQEDYVGVGDVHAANLFLRGVLAGGASRKLLFRINLRFLADYRNVLFIVLIGWVWQLFRS